MAFRPNGYLDDRRFSPDDVSDVLAMATKEVVYHKNGGVPFITVSSMPAPEPKDVHFYHYYGANGTPRDGPPPPSQRSSEPGHPESYVVVCNLEYGRLTSLDPQRSTPGISGLPSRVMGELQSVYAQVPSAVVIVMNHSGKFTIQAQLVSYQENMNTNNQMPPYSNGLNPYNPNPYQAPAPSYYPQPPPQPQVINVGPGISTIRAQAPGQPIIVYSPRPIKSKKQPYEETVVVDLNEFTDSEDDSPRVGRRGPERRRVREMRAINDGRSQLQRRHEELYQDEDGVWRRSRDSGRGEDRDERDTGREIQWKDKGRGGVYRRDKEEGDQTDRSDKTDKRDRNIYRTGNKDDRRLRNSVQDRVLGDLGADYDKNKKGGRR